MKRPFHPALLSALFTISCTFCFSQSEIPVDTHTGSPGIYIPLWNISADGISENIGLGYHASGVKIKDDDGFFGMGWGLAAGGSIIREVRGLPDDFKGLTLSDPRKGWLLPYSGTTPVAKAVGDFTSSSDQTDATCSDELNDFNKITNDFGFEKDTEPDIFHYNFGGISGSFVFDNSAVPQIRLIPYRNINIEYKISSSKEILSFTIRTDQGVLYRFSRHVRDELSTSGVSGPINFFKRHFNLNRYSNDDLLNLITGHISYFSSWQLTTIESSSGGQINFYYDEDEFATLDTVRVGIRKDNTGEVESKDVYQVYRKTKRQRLHRISGSTGQEVKIEYDDHKVTRVTILDERRTPSSFVKEFIFDHKKVYAQDMTHRYFLRSVWEQSGCDKMPPYSLSYVGIDFDNPYLALPSFEDTYARDFWGYYNGKNKNTSAFSTLYVYPGLPFPDKVRLQKIPNYTGQELILPGADRTPDFHAMQTGTLESIRYPAGGAINIDYEPHIYFDEVANQNFIGGGLRVKSVTYFDGLNPATNIVKHFEYEEQPGKSSGRLLSLPALYIPTRNYISASGLVTKTFEQLSSVPAAELWDRLIVRVDKEFTFYNTEGVRYKVATVVKPGGGSVRFEYSLPGVYRDGPNGDWQPTLNKAVRSASCTTLGIIPSSSSWTFPFSVNPNFEHERGLLLKKFEYNEAGIKISETTNHYQYIFKTGTTPFKVWGISHDSYPNADGIALFGKYFLLTDVAKVLASETVVAFDDENGSRSITSTVSYGYESPDHKLLTKIESQNSDGTIHRTRMKYPLDYGVVPASTDKHVEMIGKLQSGFMNGIPIETIKTVQRSGDTEKVISGSLVKYNDFGYEDKILPQYQLTLSTAAGINDFTGSTIELQDGNYKFRHDQRYEVVNEIVTYTSDPPKVLTQRSMDNKLISGTLWGYENSIPIATLHHTIPDEIAFSDFETLSSSSFTEHGTLYGAGRTGKNALHPSVMLSRTVTRAANTSNYILSFWINKENGSVDFRVKLKNTSLSTTYYDNTFTVSANKPGFQYFEKTIPVTNCPASFVIEVQALLPSGPYIPSSSLLPVIDDIAFYSEHAILRTATFDIPYGEGSVTTSTETVSSVRDNLGRVKLVLDQNGNIRQRNAISFEGIQAELTEGFTFKNRAYVGIPVTFTAIENCLENVTYQWDFGEGYITGAREQSHTFSSPAINKEVKLRISHPTLGYKVTKAYINVEQQIIDIGICAKGIYKYDPETDQVIEPYQCNSITATPSPGQTIFKISTVLLYGETITGYQWKKRDAGASVWQDAGSATDQLTIGDVGELTHSLEVMCIINTSAGRSIDSNVKTIHLTY